MIDVETARGLIDFGARIAAGPRVEEQLCGAVALHNILETHRVAYLADEVGFGKTYVALGALALFRHFNADFRVLILAPRDNIQQKWIKEFGNFVANNLRAPDLRMRGLDGRPAREQASCHNLENLVECVRRNSDSDFFVRMTSFSLPLGDTPAKWQAAAARWQALLSWFKPDLSSKEACKSSIARAVCCELPVFDLVIVDEAHNLKYGYEHGGSARNTVLAEVFGRAVLSDAERRHLPGYGLRARRVLFLSATPIEDSYAQLWNQLDLFGLAGEAQAPLRSADATEAQQKAAAAGFLVRRVTSLRADGQVLTKNQYRREWRGGGVQDFDQPVTLTQPRHKLIVALVQKKLGELLRGKAFNNSFQIGMLASFESFLQTARQKAAAARDADEDRTAVFEDSEQNRSASERERDGIDVDTLNSLAGDYRSRFGEEMPHPKMDAVVASLADSWVSGRKTLIFVRRVASVAELKRKLDERYDQWLIDLLRRRLEPSLQQDLEQVFARYCAENLSSRHLDASMATSHEDDVSDHGGKDTFFASFFRGKAAGDIFDGAWLQERLRQDDGGYGLFFALNDAMALLDTPAGGVGAALAQACARDLAGTGETLRQLAGRYLGSAWAKQATRFAAVQAAALELLQNEAVDADLRQRARVVWEERHESKKLSLQSAGHDPGNVLPLLERSTFFSRLGEPRYLRLRAALWPAPEPRDASPQAWRAAVREQTLRTELLSAAARLGHAFIDLYLCAAENLRSLRLDQAAQAETDAEPGAGSQATLAAYLEKLEQQRVSPDGRPWGAFDELREIAGNLALIVDVNLAECAHPALPADAVKKKVTALLSQQQPVGGTWGSVNRRLVRQFRMPGYPFVVIATDVLQEGEDLHTFCSSVMHYGIAWTPSSMEQRTGRIDRVRSQTDRRLSALHRRMDETDRLQVFFPYLTETVEVLQVDRVLDRMSHFLRLMHEGLAVPETQERNIDLAHEFSARRRRPAAVEGLLRSAFPLPEWALPGRVPAVDLDPVPAARERLANLRGELPCGFAIRWSVEVAADALSGTALFGNGRVQPFNLQLHSHRENLFVRCTTALGRVDSRAQLEAVASGVASTSLRVCASPTLDDSVFDLSVHDDVLLGPPAADRERVGLLLRRLLPAVDFIEFLRFEGQDAAAADGDAVQHPRSGA